MIFPDTLTGTRYAAETVSARGIGVPGATTALTGIRASVQRPGGHTLEKLAEGFGTRDWWYVDTATELRTFDEIAGTPADTVVIDSKDYEVHEVTHVRGVLPHYECLVKRVAAGRA